MHQISALGKKKDEQRERIVLSGYGALGICKSKKGSVYCEPKKRAHPKYRILRNQRDRL